MKIDLLIISTGSDNQFVDTLIDSVNKYFLTDHKVKISVFSDKHHTEADMTYIIPGYGTAEASLMKYHMFHEYHRDLEGDFIFFLDVKCTLVDHVGEELLRRGLTAVRHPEFYIKGGWGSTGTDKRSEAYLPWEKCDKYYTSGFQGGSRSHYLVACSVLSKRIQKDEDKGLHVTDEEHWNFYLNSGEYMSQLNELTPGYMMTQNLAQRKEWGIDGLKPKIIKQHGY